MSDPLGGLLIDLQSQMLQRLVIATGLTATVGLIALNFAAGPPPLAALALWFIMMLGCAASYTLTRASIRVRAALLFSTLILVDSLAALWFGSSLPLYLFSLLILPALLLFSRSEVAFLSLLLSLVIMFIPASDNTLAFRLLPLISLWLALWLNLVLLNTLFGVLALTQNYQTYAVSQMEEARTNRGLLAKQAKALAEAKESLEHANNQLRYARHAADESRRLKAQFAANVSHELRTPINLIVGFAEMIVSSPRAYGVSLPSAYWADINTIFRNAAHLKSLINDILDISQIEADQMALAREYIDPGVVVREGIAMLRAEIEKKGLQFNVIMPDQLPTLWLDRVRIRQVVINLLGNALRFTDQGAITVEAKIEHDSVIIGVIDTGIGVPPEAKEAVFDEFFQVDSSLARRYGGSGLGLTLSRRFVAMHQGHLWVESDGIPNHGSTFWFSLPLTHNARPIFPNVTINNSPDGERCFIVLDDDPAVQRFFERYITRQKILIADRPDQLQQLLDSEPSALIADQRFADHPALIELRKSLPIILCPMPSGRRVMQAVGVADYLVKPISQENLRNAMARIAPSFQDALIVDDDQEIVRLFTRMLQTMPTVQAIRKAYGGVEALALMRARPPDVVILDLLMPDLDGLTILQHMKKSPELAKIPVLIVSARGASEAIASHAEGHITIQKPDAFQPFELIRCVEAILDTLVT